MDKKVIAIIVLSVAFIITLIGFISASVKISKITSEKVKFTRKLKETEVLTRKLSRNMADLKAMLGKAEKEKEIIAKQAEEMKKRLGKAAQEKTERKEETFRKTPR